MDVDNTTLDFETDLIQISNIQYFEALFELISIQKNYASKYNQFVNSLKSIICFFTHLVIQ